MFFVRREIVLKLLEIDILRVLCSGVQRGKMFQLRQPSNKCVVLEKFHMRIVKFTCSSESHSPGGWPRP
jgi:hypothetical protein